MAADLAMAAFLCLALTIVLLVSIFFIYVVIRRKRLRTIETFPRTLLYLNLAFINILTAVLWTLFTAMSAATGEWILTRSICRMQVFMMSFCNIMTAHTLTVLMFERFLRIFRPSKHQEIFFDVVVLLMLAAFYVLDGLIASFTLWGWAESSYFSDQFQCAVDYVESASHYDFTIAMHFGLPIALCLVFYIAIIIRIKLLRRKLTPGARIVLQEDLEVPGDSYSDRLKKQYLKFHGAATSENKPKIKKAKEYQNDGFGSDDDEDMDSDKEQASDDKVGSSEAEDGKRSIFNRNKGLKKTYLLTKEDVSLSHMHALMAAVYFILWFPFIVQSYIYTYYFFEMTLNKSFILAAVVLSHFSPCFHVPLFVFSDKLRAAMKKTLGLGKTEEGDGKSNEVAEDKLQTTEL